MASINMAKSRGATLRVGPELEIPSVYFCEFFTASDVLSVAMAVMIIS